MPGPLRYSRDLYLATVPITVCYLFLAIFHFLIKHHYTVIDRTRMLSANCNSRLYFKIQDFNFQVYFTRPLLHSFTPHSLLILDSSLLRSELDRVRLHYIGRAAIRKAFKGGGTLHSPHTLRLVSADAGTKTQTPGALMAVLSTPDSPPVLQPDEPRDWLDLELDTATTPTPQRHPRHVDVSADIRDLLHQREANDHDQECTSAPNYIPEWVLPSAELQALIDEGKGATPDLIYARGIPDFPNPPPTNVCRSECALLLIEIGFCRAQRFPRPGPTK